MKLIDRSILAAAAAAAVLVAGACSKSAGEQSAPAAAVAAAPAAGDNAAPAVETESDSHKTETGGTAPEVVVLDEATQDKIFNSRIKTLEGEETTLGALRGKALLVVNVASKCGLTPQYTDLEALHKEYADKGFSVVGMPCNQFGGQEPGTAEEIRKFCSLTYGVTFPMMEKIEVNGDGRHPIYEALTAIPDADGKAGDIQWNFEKFLISADGKTVVRFRPRTNPKDPAVVAALDRVLPGDPK